MEDHSHKKLDNGPPRQFSAEELAPQIMIRKAKKAIRTRTRQGFKILESSGKKQRR